MPAPSDAAVQPFDVRRRCCCCLLLLPPLLLLLLPPLLLLLPPPLLLLLPPPLLLLPPLLLIESFHVQGVAQDSNDDSDLMPTGARLPSPPLLCAASATLPELLAVFLQDAAALQRPKATAAAAVV